MPTDELTADNHSARTIAGITLARVSSLRARVAGAAVTVVLVVTAVTLPVAALSGTETDTGVETAAEPATPTTFSAHVASFPDRIADHVGGVAARLHLDGEVAVPGDLFALFATNGSDDAARLYDTTAYTLVREDVHPEMAASNQTAAGVVADIVGHDVSPLDFTSAPAGGFSAGLTFAVGYLNEVSDGAFTGDVGVAATGALDDDGYLDWVTAIDEKTAAAQVAEVDVMFTTATPTYSTLDRYAARYEGDLHGARRTGTALAAERNWSAYEQLGADRPTAGMDVVAVAHLGDVAAYLCGAGSAFACDVRATLADTTIGALAPEAEQVAATEDPAGVKSSGIAAR
jgi:hypothetical protein